MSKNMITLAFACTRIAQVFTLAPLGGILTYIAGTVDVFSTRGGVRDDSDGRTVLLATTIIALIWAVSTLLGCYRFTLSTVPLTVVVVVLDAAVVFALIAGVYMTRDPIQNCDARPPRHWLAVKLCSMYRASWALAIANILLFCGSAGAAAAAAFFGKAISIRRSRAAADAEAAPPAE